MGGPGGASPKVNPSHFFSPGDLRREEDFYQSNTCVNCHADVPKNPCNSCHTTQFFASATLLPKPSPCDAEFRWPDFLQTPIPRIRDYPWWVEQNFLSTQLQKPGTPIHPQKIDFGIEIFLKPEQSFKVSDYLFETREDAKIVFAPHLAGQGENLSILLENQSLLELKNIRVTPNAWYGGLLPSNWLQEVIIQEGHPILRAAIGALNLFRNKDNPAYSDVNLQEFIWPTLPIAYDTQSAQVFTGKDYESLKNNSSSTIQRIATTYEIYESQRLPQQIKLSEILQLIADLAKVSKLKKDKGPSALDQAVASLVVRLESIPDEIKYPNFYARFYPDPQKPLSLRIETKGTEKIESINARGELNLAELFIPELLHLGDAHANIKMSYRAGSESLVDIDNIRAYFKPMDYFKDNPRKLGWLFLQEGFVEDGSAVQHMGYDFPPGIHLERLSNDLFQIQANLRFNFNVELPLVGKISLSLPILFMTQIKSDILELITQGNMLDSLKLLPESTLIHLPDLEITRGENAQKQSFSLNLMFTDIPHLMNPNNIGFFDSGFWMSAFLETSQNSPIDNGFIETFIALDKAQDGTYLFQNLLEFFDLRSILHLTLKDKSQISGNIDFDSQSNGNENEINLHASLEQGQNNSVPSRKIVDALHFSRRIKKENNHQQVHYTLDADAFYWGPIGLTHPHVHLLYDEDKMQDGTSRWNIHDYGISANNLTSPTKPSGILRGPLVIRNTAKPHKSLQILFDPTTHQLDISNLGLAFDIKRISIPEIAKFTKRGITGIDLDGRIQGHWKMNSETFAGRGRIVVSGDKEGDIHIRGKNGMRLEAPLNPDDPDRYYQIPLLANTRFVMGRLKAFDPKKEQLQGHFHLTTLVDWLALKALGIEWNEHDEFTFDFDHLPYSERGYATKIREFFTFIAAQNRKTEAKP